MFNGVYEIVKNVIVYYTHVSIPQHKLLHVGAGLDTYTEPNVFSQLHLAYVTSLQNSPSFCKCV